MAKKSFYDARTYTGQLRPGHEIDIQRAIYYRGEHADFKPFLTVPHKELEQRLKESMAEEKKIYDELQKAAKAWDEHGAQTLLLQKAIEYLKTEPVKHTGNEWKQGKDGTWEISNLVYQMTFKIVPFGDEWKLSWELQYTAPGQPQDQYYYDRDRGPKKRIEYEGSKKYKTMAGAQKYVQSKFDQYARCFETLSPPVPEAVKSLFCVNGQLLQGYTVAQGAASMEAPGQVAPDTKAVEKLLAFLEDEEAPGPAPEQTGGPPSKREKGDTQPAHKRKPPAPQKTRNRRKASMAPVR